MSNTNATCTHSISIDFLKSLAHELTEVRILRRNPYMVLSGKREFVGDTVSGYYTPDTYPKLIEDIKPFEANTETKGIYITLQCANPALHARSENRLQFKAQETTSDDWITHFTTFPIDVDSDNPSGTSASESELETSKNKADQIACFLKELGIPYVPAMSGNGWHILIYVHLLENTPENAARWKAVGDLVASRFGSDVTNYNPARIWKLYGTTAKKGDSTEERPHRISTLWLPDEIQRISFDDLEAKLTEAIPKDDPEPKAKDAKSHPNGKQRSLREWLDDHNISYTEKPYKGTFKYQVDCPHDSSHKRPDAWVTDEGGKWQFSCSHNSCKDRSTWQAFKDAHSIRDKSSQHGGTRAKSGRKSNAEKASEISIPEIFEGKPVVMLNETQEIETEDNSIKIFVERSREMVSDDVVHLVWNSKRIFRRGSELGLLRENSDSLEFDPIENTGLQGEIARIVTLMKFADGKLTTVANPPDWLAADVLINQNIKEVPEIKVILSHPYWDGEKIVMGAGFQKDKSVYLNNTDIDYDLDLNKHTANDDIELWRALLRNFPFKDESDFENALAYPLTLMIRQGLKAGEEVPLTNITAPREGIGKSLLADVLTAAVLGYKVQNRQLGYSKEEIEKRLGSALRGAPGAVIFDNVDTDVRLDSGVLASVLTQGKGAFRILGESKETFFENRAVFIYTGSNVEVTPELAKRLIAVRLQDPGIAEKDRKVEIESILQYVIENHVLYVSSLLRIVQRWIDAGMQEAPENLHRMRQWSRVIHGIMLENGIGEHFMKNNDEVMLQANPEFTAWSNAFKAIVEELGEEKAQQGFIVSDVFEILSYRDNVYGRPRTDGGLGTGLTTLAKGDNILGEFIGESKNDKARAQKLARMLRSKVGTVFAEWELIDTHQTDTRTRCKLYALKWRGETRGSDEIDEMLLKRMDGVLVDDYREVVKELSNKLEMEAEAIEQRIQFLYHEREQLKMHKVNDEMTYYHDAEVKGLLQTSAGTSAG